ncbi:MULTISPECIES: DUF202 domain-containing protein [Pseudonocardia]|uniref:DUF202 domain-containing protein n=1 Tax=Pseudonocardia abyssalis TaxID=2792008 RepID=A0ABS6V0E3_9PSEU|nr:DUF202 domain-containing protein [Pseudonocardia abyssalis]MBW0115135.1 DUF202 domain-containing protein [Pseudonocardia abyssalis]MBW0137974.1 DUF202 domain-containing protein [Pseudonocardia abyssalis]
MTRPHRTAAGVRGGRSDRPGRQAERTGLAWERTALALLVNGSLLLLRHSATGGPAVLAAVIATVAALATAALGLLRARRIRAAAHRVPVERGAMWTVGVLVIGVGAAVGAAELLFRA